MMNSFWWEKSGNGSRGINWLSWDKLVDSKEHGSMSFRSLQGFNLAMLRKRGWKCFSDPDVIVSCIFKTKYFSNGDWVESNFGHNPSYS